MRPVGEMREPDVRAHVRRMHVRPHARNRVPSYSQIAGRIVDDRRVCAPVVRDRARFGSIAPDRGIDERIERRARVVAGVARSARARRRRAPLLPNARGSGVERHAFERSVEVVLLHSRAFIVGKSTCSMSMRAPTRLNMSCSSTAICWRCVLVPGTRIENCSGTRSLVTNAILAHHPAATLENRGAHCRAHKGSRGSAGSYVESAEVNGPERDARGGIEHGAHGAPAIDRHGQRAANVAIAEDRMRSVPLRARAR